MAWLEITIDTTPQNIDDTTAFLTAGGFSDLVIEARIIFRKSRLRPSSSERARTRSTT